MKAGDDRPVGNWPQISEGQWLAFAIASGVFTFIAFVVGAFYVFSYDDSSVRLNQSRALAPLGAFFVAVVTFFTVAWRGQITTRQADQQLEQLRATQAQIRASEEINLADSLRKGAELISAYGSPQKVIAGVVSLEAVAANTDGQYADQAMDILADYLKRKHSHSHDDEVCKLAIRALRSTVERYSGKQPRRQSEHAIDFKVGDEMTGWECVVGVQEVNYTGGHFQTITNFNLANKWSRLPSLTFVNVVFDNCYFDFPASFDNCTFNKCLIHVFRIQDLKRSHFNGCNFSKCRFLGSEDLPPRIQGEGNHYEMGHDPRASRPVDWSHYLDVVPGGEGAGRVPAVLVFDVVDIGED